MGQRAHGPVCDLDPAGPPPRAATRLRSRLDWIRLRFAGLRVPSRQPQGSEQQRRSAPSGATRPCASAIGQRGRQYLAMRRRSTEICPRCCSTVVSLCRAPLGPRRTPSPAPVACRVTQHSSGESSTPRLGAEYAFSNPPCYRARGEVDDDTWVAWTVSVGGISTSPLVADRREHEPRVLGFRGTRYQHRRCLGASLREEGKPMLEQPRHLMPSPPLEDLDASAPRAVATDGRAGPPWHLRPNPPTPPWHQTPTRAMPVARAAWRMGWILLLQK